MVLEVSQIHTYYGSSHVLQGVSLSVAEGEVVCLLGRNGAGKTTTLRTIMGLAPPRSGSVKARGREIGGLPPHAIARLGIGFVPEDRRVYPDLTVRENLLVVHRRGDGAGRAWTVDRVYELFPVLARLDSHKGGYLSGGEQQMLTIGRTLMTNPRILLLDEPAEGLSPLVVQALAEQIMRLKREGMTILLSEQNLRFATHLSDRAYVIEKGTIRYEGTVAEFEQNEAVRHRYLMV
ncbi:MAG: ABC transporter ATP-binding protein [Candidatus Rokubacteria bacterium]|nr:ABC transporter ATP-binding protein [Candidatus Rokubacteria bacterium]